MSRLTGRVSMPGAEGASNDARNKRMMAGLLGHLNAAPRQAPRQHREMREEDVGPSTNLEWRNDDGRRGNYHNKPNNYNANNVNNRGRGRGRGRGARGNHQAQEGERRRVETTKIEDHEPAEELLELEEIIAQISDLNIRSDRSAAQIKRNIIKSTDLTDSLDEEEWQQICECLTKTALTHGEYDFVVDLFVSFLSNESFCDAMSAEIMSISTNFIMSNGTAPVPAFLASILCAHWPRQFSKAIDTVNLILYSTVCVIKGWIQVLEEDTQIFHKEEKKPAYKSPSDPKRDAENQENKEEEEEENEETEPEDPEVVNKCAIALSELCDEAQRQLWMKWPTICDEIFMCIKPAITHNTNINGDTKTRLLSTYLNINNWTKTRSINMKNSQTQTVSQSS